MWPAIFNLMISFQNALCNVLSQQTQNICITFVQCWTNVEDVGSRLYKCYTNVLCLLGYVTIVHRFNPADMRHFTNVDLRLGHRRRRWANLKPTLVKWLVFSGKVMKVMLPACFVFTGRMCARAHPAHMGGGGYTMKYNLYAIYGRNP